MLGYDVGQLREQGGRRDRRLWWKGGRRDRRLWWKGGLCFGDGLDCTCRLGCVGGSSGGNRDKFAGGLQYTLQGV